MFSTTDVDLDAVQAAFQAFYSDPVVFASTIIVGAAGAFAALWRMFTRFSRVIG